MRRSFLASGTIGLGYYRKLHRPQKDWVTVQRVCDKLTTHAYVGKTGHGFAKIAEALAFDLRGTMFLRPSALVAERSKIGFARGIMEFSAKLNQLTVTLRKGDLPKKTLKAIAGDIPVDVLRFTRGNDHIVRVKDGILYSRLDRLSRGDNESWWVLSDGFKLDANGDVQAPHLKIPTEVQNKPAPGLVQIRRHIARDFHLQVKMGLDFKQTWRALYVSKD